MPKMHICSEPGCHITVPYGTWYCAKHEPPPNVMLLRLKKRQKKPMKYDAEWRRTRAEYIAMYPTCVECGAEARHVDHIIDIRDGGTNDEENLQSMCVKCHSKKTLQKIGKRKTAKKGCF